jgi:hypothetical protein
MLQAVEAASSRARRHDAMATVLTARVVSCAGADGCLGRDQGTIREDFHMGEPLERKKPNTVRTGDREKLVNAMRDEALIKQLKDAMYSERIREKALDVLVKRIASGEISADMLLRIIVSLSKSTEDWFRRCLEVDRPPRRRP